MGGSPKVEKGGPEEKRRFTAKRRFTDKPRFTTAFSCFQLFIDDPSADLFTCFVFVLAFTSCNHVRPQLGEQCRPTQLFGKQ